MLSCKAAITEPPLNELEAEQPVVVQSEAANVEED